MMSVRQIGATALRWHSVAMLLVLAVLTYPHSAKAQALDIDQPEFDKGEREVRWVNVVNGRYPPGSRDVARSSHELSASYSLAEWFKITAHLDVENMMPDGWRIDHGAIETQFQLIEASKSGGLGLGWFTSVQLSTDPLSTNSLIFGPVAKMAGRGGSLTLNPYLEDTFGRNSGPGFNLLLGWEARVDLQTGLAVGLQGFGKVENVADAPPWSEQDHRIGPALFMEWPLDAGRHFALDMALLAGLTEATPDWSLKANLGTTF